MEKDILLQVKTDLADSVKRMAEINAKVYELKVSEKELKAALEDARVNGFDAQGRSVQQLMQEIAANTEAQKAHRKELNEISRTVQNTIISENTYKDTLKGMAAQLSVEKDKLRQIKLSHGELTDEYIRQQNVVNDLNKKVSLMEQAYGVYTRNVGNYKSGVQELNRQLLIHLQRLSDLPAGSAAWNKESQEIEKVTSELEELNKEQEKGAQGSETWRDKIGKFAKEYAAAIAIIVAAFKFLKGLFTELVEKTQSWGDEFKIEVAGMKSAYDSLVRSLASGEGWNQLINNLKVAYANGRRFAELLDEIFERENSLKIQEADYSAVIEENRVIARNTTLTYEERLKAAETVLAKEKELAEIRKDIAQQDLTAKQGMLMTQTGMSEEDITRYINQYNQNRELVEKAKEYVKLYQEYSSLTNKGASFGTMTITSEDAARRDELEKETSARWEAMTQDERDFVALFRKYELANDELIQQYVDSYVKMQTVEAEYTKANARMTLQRDKALEEVMSGESTNTKGDDENAKASREAQKRLDERKALDAALLKEQRQYHYDSSLSEEQNAEAQWQHQREWAAREFELNQSYEREKMRIQSEYGDIDATQYRMGLDKLESESRTFYDQQTVEAEEHFRKMAVTLANAIVAGDSVDSQINAVRKKYQALLTDVEVMVEEGTLSREEAAYYRAEIARREAEDVTAIEKEARDKRTKEEQKAVEEEYKNRQQKLSTDLKLAWDNADEQYRIRREYLEKELELYKHNAEERAELERQLNELNKEYHQQRLDLLSDYVTQVEDLLGSINDIHKGYDDSRIQEYEESNQQQKATLEKRLKAGLISQKQYDDKVVALDKELDQQKAQITQREAIRERELAIFQIGINTAQAVMKIWAEVPKMDFGVSTGVLTALAIALGAAQIAAVVAEPLPKARKGGKVEGPTHENGGVLVEAEGGERIVAAQPSKAYEQLLDLIGYVGKHEQPGEGKSFIQNISNQAEGGERAESTANSDTGLLATALGAISYNLVTAMEMMREGDIINNDTTRIIQALDDKAEQQDNRLSEVTAKYKPTTVSELSVMSILGTTNLQVPDTGFASRYYEQNALGGAGGQGGKVDIDYERLSGMIGERMKEAVSELQIWLSLTELRDEEKKLAHIESLARQ